MGDGHEFAGIFPQADKEAVHQIFEIIPLCKDERTLKQRACGKGLDRLQETAPARIVDELAYRCLPGFYLKGRGPEPFRKESAVRVE
ncbi:hypothetical protein J2Z31_001622 [Sinorhizobium kostiense]|uniref:Uncharacterized protein n=1 Tax=Sinorhizobium kostiense TaxID=76747 RepID=A0ABS4QWV8_9HYPH|nr:hypothetical protein [Sinorhizobium kostiense]